MFFLQTLLTEIGHFVSGINPVALEIIKIFAVSFGWIGSLTFFMWKREQHKNKKTGQTTSDLKILEAA